MHVIQETRRLSDECSIQNQAEKTFYGVSENEIVHLTSEILMSHNLRLVFKKYNDCNRDWLNDINLLTYLSSHLANIRMILQVRMNTLIDQQQLESFLKQYPGIDDIFTYFQHTNLWPITFSSSIKSVFSNKTRNNFIFAYSSIESSTLWIWNIDFEWKRSSCIPNIWRYYNSQER